MPSAQERLAARARRISAIRQRVVAAVLASFVLAWGVVAFDGSKGAETTATAQATTATATTSSSTDTTSSDGSTTFGDSSSSPSSGDGSTMTTSQS